MKKSFAAIICALVCTASMLVFMSGCATSGGDTNSLPAPAEKPQLVEPEFEEEEEALALSHGLVNGDFSLGFDAYGALTGWEVNFSQWGEGEESASYGLSQEDDNLPNTTQKLSLYNAMAEAVDFSVRQTVEGMAAGQYVASFIYEGGPEGADPRLALVINGERTECAPLSGWQNWKQAVSPSFAVAEGDKVEISIEGALSNKVYLDIDDVQLVLADSFEPKVFEAAALARPVGAIYPVLTNGDFETPATPDGDVTDWIVQCTNWGSGEERAVYRLTKEDEGENKTQKLTFANETGDFVTFTTSQRIAPESAGAYIPSLLFEGSAPVPGSRITLSANGKQIASSDLDGWGYWHQIYTGEVFPDQNGLITIEISIRLASSGWLDLDDIELVPAQSFTPRVIVHPPYEPDIIYVRPPVPILDHLTNADFSQGVNWSRPAYPDGYLPGWQLPSVDWDTWRFTVVDGVFNLDNISGRTTADTFTIKQKVHLAAGRYLLSANTPWTWDESNPTGVTLQVLSGANVLTSVQKSPGWGPFEAGEFVLDKKTTVEVAVTFSLTGVEGKATGAIDDIELKRIVAWEDAAQVGGASGLADTTAIELTFEDAIPTLDASCVTLTGATKGALTHNGGGKYTLDISGITVADGQTVKVEIAGPGGYAITPGSKTVQVFSTAPAPSFTDPIQNPTLTKAGVYWAVPKGWNMTVGGSSIVDGPSYEAAFPAVGGGPDWGAISLDPTFTVNTEQEITDFSLTQDVQLPAGSYKLKFEVENYLWGLTIGNKQLKVDDIGTFEDSFTMQTDGTYTIRISADTIWAGNTFTINRIWIEPDTTAAPPVTRAAIALDALTPIAAPAEKELLEEDIPVTGEEDKTTVKEEKTTGNTEESTVTDTSSNSTEDETETTQPQANATPPVFADPAQDPAPAKKEPEGDEGPGNNNDQLGGGEPGDQEGMAGEAPPAP